MSVKAMGLVWDLECPATINGIDFKPTHKYCLLAYADHADHKGENIFPAVETVAGKMGVIDRTVQRLTRDLEDMGYLIDDGFGPRGTNKWKLPYDHGGVKLSPRQINGATNGADPSGVIPLGDIPSGDNLTPELNKPLTDDNKKDELIKIIQGFAVSVFSDNFQLWSNWKHQLELNCVQIDGTKDGITISVAGRDGQFSISEIWEERYKKSFENIGLKINFLESTNERITSR